MSTYKKSGLRIIKVREDFKIKKHLKEFYKTLKELTFVAEHLCTLDVKFDLSNINNYAVQYLNRDLDDTEKMMLLGKINLMKNEQRDND